MTGRKIEDIMRQFTSLASYTIAQRGTVYEVAADLPMIRDHHGLLGQIVMIDGAEHKVLGVELRPITRQSIHTGEVIGLLVAGD